MAKYYASEAAVRAANAALQVFGGYGYIDEFPVARYLRDARVMTLYEGTSQLQKLLIGAGATRESTRSRDCGLMAAADTSSEPEGVRIHMRAVFIAAAKRTPIGRLRGALSSVRPDDLAATVVRGLLAEAPRLDPERIDDVYWAPRTRPARTTAMSPGWRCCWPVCPVSVPGATLNRLCASGLEAFTVAARTIAAGEADIVIAGGSESMTRAPYVLPRPEGVCRTGWRSRTRGWAGAWSIR